VERILQLAAGDVLSMGGLDTVIYGDRPLALVRLDGLLGLPGAGSRPDWPSPAVVLRSGERQMMVMIDELLGEQEVVIKGLGRQLRRVCGIGGATVMGSGEVVLILNTGDLFKLAALGERPSVLAADRATAGTARVTRPRILVVDDSITTRTLERNILEAVGYEVRIATDGQEALAALAAGELPDLVISDILMPRVDGFELTARLRRDVRTAALPVILVSSLESIEDKTRGIEVGADAYIVKSGFDQQALLDTIEQLI
jgi:two-component system chemotaxis sensor kinase CheA